MFEVLKYLYRNIRGAIQNVRSVRRNSRKYFFKAISSSLVIIVSDNAQIWLIFITVYKSNSSLFIMIVPGNGNSILRSIRPGRISAGSKDSILFVAIITLTSPLKKNIFSVNNTSCIQSGLEIILFSSLHEVVKYLHTLNQTHLIDSIVLT